MGRDAAIHRVPRCAVGDCGSLSGSQWIATGYALAMTIHGLRQNGRVPCPTTVSLRGATKGRDAAIHRVPKDAYGDAVRLVDHSGSPRATHSR